MTIPPWDLCISMDGFFFVMLRVINLFIYIIFGFENSFRKMGKISIE